MRNVNFVQIGKKHPCEGCSAPCCRTQLFSAKVPRGFMDLDWFGYLLNFPKTEILYYANGDFNIIKWEDCGHLKDNRCTVHSTPDQPRTCVYYNPHNCWYYRNFTQEVPLDLLRLNRARYDVWVTMFMLDQNNEITYMPSFHESRAAVQHIPITPMMPETRVLTELPPVQAPGSSGMIQPAGK
jgi:hypothetical protein